MPSVAVRRTARAFAPAPRAPAVHDRIELVNADANDRRRGFLEAMDGYLGGELRPVTDSRAVIDLEGE